METTEFIIIGSYMAAIAIISLGVLLYIGSLRKQHKTNMRVLNDQIAIRTEELTRDLMDAERRFKHFVSKCVFLEYQISALTRKRDKNGRFVKMNP